MMRAIRRVEKHIYLRLSYIYYALIKSTQFPTILLMQISVLWLTHLLCILVSLFRNSWLNVTEA